MKKPSEEYLKKILEVDALIFNGKYRIALDILKTLELNSVVRKFITTCYVKLEMDKEIIELLREPYDISEFIYLTNSLWKFKDYTGLNEILIQYEDHDVIRNAEAYKRMKRKLDDRRHDH